MLTFVDPRDVGLNPRSWQTVLELAQKLVDDGDLPALAFQVQQGLKATPVVALGHADSDRQVPLHRSHRFLVASLTKPIVAMAVLQLVERGLLTLNDRVVDWLPEFSEAAKRNITIRHLLTHTSGLPDMLPNNAQLRQEHAPVAAFVEGTCHVSLDYVPGRDSRYQSMGYALLDPIIQRASGRRCREFLRENIFQPLGMTQTCLGTEPGDDRSDIAHLQVPPEQLGGGAWNWNSEYWHQLGAPWGGLISTVEDLSLFCACINTDGSSPQGKVFSPATVRMATENRLYDYPAILPETRDSRGWGCGWRLNWLDHRSCFSDLLPASVVGHWGATGTLFWIDQVQQTAAVLLTTQPIERNASPLTRLSNAIVAAFLT